MCRLVKVELPYAEVQVQEPSVFVRVTQLVGERTMQEKLCKRLSVRERQGNRDTETYQLTLLFRKLQLPPA